MLFGTALCADARTAVTPDAASRAQASPLQKLAQGSQPKQPPQQQRRGSTVYKPESQTD
jgi:hypothetical protein